MSDYFRNRNFNPSSHTFGDTGCSRCKVSGSETKKTVCFCRVLLSHLVLSNANSFKALYKGSIANTTLCTSEESRLQVDLSALPPDVTEVYFAISSDVASQERY